MQRTSVVGLELLQRVTRTSIISGSILFPVISTYLGLAAGVAWVLGVGWSLINIYLIGLLVRFAYADGKKRRLWVALIFLIKVPVLYLIGFLLLRGDRLPDPGLIAGFMWPLSVIVLKASARLILRLDDRKETVFGPDPSLIHKK